MTQIETTLQSIAKKLAVFHISGLVILSPEGPDDACRNWLAFPPLPHHHFATGKGTSLLAALLQLDAALDAKVSPCP